MKALGCFNDAMGNRLFPELLDNHRDPINGHHGFTIDWHNYGQSIEEYAYCDISLLLDYTNLDSPGFDRMSITMKNQSSILIETGI